MTTKATLDANRVRFIEIALRKLERDLELTEGSDKEAVLLVHEWLFNVQHTLTVMGAHTVH
jgi:hypothetical protein